MESKRPRKPRNKWESPKRFLWLFLFAEYVKNSKLLSERMVTIKCTKSQARKLWKRIERAGNRGEVLPCEYRPLIPLTFKEVWAKWPGKWGGN